MFNWKVRQVIKVTLPRLFRVFYSQFFWLCIIGILLLLFDWGKLEDINKKFCFFLPKNLAFSHLLHIYDACRLFRKLVLLTGRSIIYVWMKLITLSVFKRFLVNFVSSDSLFWEKMWGQWIGRQFVVHETSIYLTWCFLGILFWYVAFILLNFLLRRHRMSLSPDFFGWNF